MNSTVISMMLTKSISKSSTMIRLIGILSILLFGYLGFISWRELQSFPPAPQRMTLSEAASHVSEQRMWVVIDDIQWDCGHIFYTDIDRNTHTDIVFTDKTNNLWGYATFSSEITCDEVMQEEGVGVLGIANEKKRDDLIENGFDVSKHETNGEFLALCTYCGRDNSQWGVVVSSMLIIIGVSLVGTANRMERKNKLSQSRLYLFRHRSA